MKRVKRISAAFLALAITATGLAACSSSSSSSTAESTGTPSATVETGKLATDAGTFPIVKDKTTLNILVQQNGTCTDFDNADQTKVVESKTGINIEWTLLPSTSDASQKLKLILSSDKLPDIFFNDPGMTQSDIYTLAQQGTFLDLSPYISKYGVETQKMFKEVSYSKEMITYPDGKIYSLPYINDCYHAHVYQRMFIYKPWLDKLGLKMPTTTDELYTVLKAFKEKDPNGNGKADEVPLEGNTADTGSIASFLMNAFTYYSIDDQFYVDDNGKVQIPYASDAWKNGLTYMNKLYADGLVAPESFTQNEDQLGGIVKKQPETVGAFTDRFSHGMTGWGDSTIGTLNSDYVAVPPLKGPDGTQLAVWRPYASSHGDRFMITNSCKNPDVAFRLGDYLLSQEQTEISLMGVEGKAWKKASADEKGIDGRAAVYHQLDNAPANETWGVQLPMLATNDLRMGMAATGGASKNLEVSLYQMTKQYEPYKVEEKNVVPTLYFTEDEETRLSDLSSIKSYVNESMARFITGDMKIDKDWSSYVKELDTMGFKEYQELYQGAYDKVKKTGTK